MKRMLAVILLGIVLLFTGCAVSEPVSKPIPEPNYGTPSIPSSMSTPNPTSTSSPTIDNFKPPEDRTWISPGKVNVANFYPGAKAEYPITIHNGKETTATFAVSYREPNRVEEGYSFAPSEAEDWVIIADSTLVLLPRETKDITIRLEMPKDPMLVPIDIATGKIKNGNFGFQ
jgi:hypothetical protein